MLASYEVTSYLFPLYKKSQQKQSEDQLL